MTVGTQYFNIKKPEFLLSFTGFADLKLFFFVCLFYKFSRSRNDVSCEPRVTSNLPSFICTSFSIPSIIFGESFLHNSLSNGICQSVM